MSDFVSGWMLLKAAAETAEAERIENGHRWPEVDECDWFDTSSGHEYEYLCAASPTTVMSLLAENESLRADAERYRWLRDAKGLSLRSDGSKWTRSNGEQFICSHHLCAFDTSYAAYESLDEVIDAAISSPENP